MSSWWTKADAWWQIGGWTAIVIGMAVAAWALFWDRSQGRKRCPKCWYDMSQLSARPVGQPHRCPECGDVAAHERRLLGTRRQWKMAALACLVILAGVSFALPQTRSSSWWIERLPNALLIHCRLIDPVDWFCDARTPLGLELDKRLTHRVPHELVPADPNVFVCFPSRGPKGWMSDSEARHWAMHVAASVRESIGKTRVSGDVVEVYDLGEIVRRANPECSCCGFDSNVRQVQDFFQSEIERDKWYENGGDVAFHHSSGGYWIVQADAQMHRELDRALKVFREHSWK